MSIRFEISPNGSGSERERRKGLHRCSIGGGEGDRAPPLGPNIARPIVDCCAEHGKLPRGSAKGRCP
jgi:hypothetical protein